MASSVDEKSARLTNVDPSSETQVSASSDNSVDQAWRFLNEHRNGASDQPIVDMAALRHKIDWHIVPLMFCCYTMQFLDKVILNVRFRTLPTSMISALFTLAETNG